jgi:3-(3-hydroxy-phenyl)propionate hydroxylase
MEIHSWDRFRWADKHTHSARRGQIILTNMKYDAIIIGYGPAGATLANLLAIRGWRVAVVEQSLRIYDKPRAITADHECMRVFQECGLAEDIVSGTSPHPGTDFVGMDNKVVKRFYPQPGSKQLGWEPSFMFVQPQLEEKLRAGIERHKHVHVLLSHRFLQFEAENHEVRVQVHDLSNDRDLELTAKYLIACDGASSPVRRQLETVLEDLEFDEWWMVIDAWIRGPLQLPQRCVQYCRPTRPGTYIIGPGDLRRWEIKLLPGEGPDDFHTEESIRRVLSEFVDAASLELCRTAVYRFHAVVAERWRSGRVFLAGDAAHQMPPFLGQGMCAGVRDVVNLAWKLDMVERLGATAGILDTYGIERKPHVRTIVSLAKSFGLIIGELDPEAARSRDVRLRAELESGQAETVRQKFIPGLTAGIIATDASGTPKPGAGSLFVQPRVRKHGSTATALLDDMTGACFLLASEEPGVLEWLDPKTRDQWLRLKGKMTVIGGAHASLPPEVITVSEDDGIFREFMAQHGARAVLVRPDRYVYGVASNADSLRQMVGELHDRIFGPSKLRQP